jgi:hypothetical protein
MAAKTENHRIEVSVITNHRKGFVEVAVSKKFIPDDRAEFAMRLMSHFALVAALPHGEDTAGHQRNRLQTPSEIVSHCCEVAERAFVEFDSRGWMVGTPPLPTPADVENSWADSLKHFKAAQREDTPSPSQNEEERPQG